jgi:hypothetical protein
LIGQHLDLAGDAADGRSFIGNRGPEVISANDFAIEIVRAGEAATGRYCDQAGEVNPGPPGGVGQQCGDTLSAGESTAVPDG